MENPDVIQTSSLLVSSMYLVKITNNKASIALCKGRHLLNVCKHCETEQEHPFRKIWLKKQAKQNRCPKPNTCNTGTLGTKA